MLGKSKTRFDEEPQRSPDHYREQQLEPSSEGAERQALQWLRLLLGGRRAYAVSQIAFNTRGLPLQGADQLFAAAFVSDEDGGRIHATRGLLQLSAQSWGYLLDRTVNARFLADGDKDSRTSLSEERHAGPPKALKLEDAGLHPARAHCLHFPTSLR